MEPEFPVVGDTAAAAFFDLDNTVMQGAALYHFGRGLYKRHFFHKRDLARFAWQQIYFRLVSSENPEHMADVRNSALSIVQGHRVAELMSIGEEIYDEYMAERVWPGTRALAQAHLDSRPEGLAGHRGPRRDRDDHRPPPRPDRRAGHRRRIRRRCLYGQAGRRAAARPGQGRGRPRAGRGRGPGPVALRRLQRLRQRHSDALARRAPVCDQSRQPHCASTPGNRAGGCATTGPAGRRPRSASPRRPGSARSQAAPRPRSHSSADAADQV